MGADALPNRMTLSAFHVPPLSRGYVAHRLRRTATDDIDLLQLALRKKADRPAVRRPEHLIGALGPGERLLLEPVDPAYGQYRQLRVIGVYPERDLSAVWRYSRPRSAPSTTSTTKI